MLNIEQARRARGWSQAELSQYSRISQQYICEIERGVAWPVQDQRERLAACLRVPVATLLDEVRVPEVELMEQVG
jgi:transcriptional regulator with XRE-family HTH domain